jgi:hypothetical protein
MQKYHLDIKDGPGVGDLAEIWITFFPELELIKRR